MENYPEFFESIEKAASVFRRWDKEKKISLISHLDADGISSCAILTKLMNDENRKYTISILTQLSERKIKEIAKDNSDYIIFSDLGSGQIKDIAKNLGDKEIIILDHHEPDKLDKEYKNITHINPHLFGIDGSKEIAGAGVCYLFAKCINKTYENLSHLAIIGAIGDIQEDKGFKELNKEILKTAVDNKLIKVKKSLRIFGINTRPIHKALEYSTDINIPGVSGSESGAIQFLYELGINPKKDNNWKTLNQLSDDEVKKLVTGIIMKRLGKIKPDDVLGDSYAILTHEEDSTRDAREFATLLNACGRMEKASVGIGVCLGEKKDIQRAMQVLADYKKEIVNAIEWYKSNEKGEFVIRGNNYIIINAQDRIKSTVVGTLASIISKSDFVSDKTYIMSLAKSEEEYTKLSLRMKKLEEGDDLRKIVKEIALRVGGEAGGHMSAAGALIPLGREKEIIEAAKEVLGKTIL